MGRPPLIVVFVAIVVITLGELGGAVLSQLRPATARWAAARIAANPTVHGLTGSAEYDDAVRERTVFATEAGLSFFHTHAEGTGLVLFFAATLVASVVRPRAVRAALSSRSAISCMPSPSSASAETPASSSPRRGCSRRSVRRRSWV